MLTPTKSQFRPKCTGLTIKGIGCNQIALFDSLFCNCHNLDLLVCVAIVNGHKCNNRVQKGRLNTFFCNAHEYKMIIDNTNKEEEKNTFDTNVVCKEDLGATISTPTKVPCNNVKINSPTRTNCSAITLKGLRCKKKVQKEEEREGENKIYYCNIHKNDAQVIILSAEVGKLRLQLKNVDDDHKELMNSMGYTCVGDNPDHHQ
jgi:hypothetical protein